METLARFDMALSLAFHIIFASIGMTMPLLMALAELLHFKTGRKVYLELAKAWAKGTAVFFAVGAVSGTVLSFELGLLFPAFMGISGSVIGLPFALEGFAFFTEAIFLGIYLYGWNRVSARVHLFAGFVVALSGLLSGFFVTLANSWMQFPVGARFDGVRFVEINVWEALFSPFAWHQVPHSLLAAYVATGMVVVGIHSFVLLRNPKSEFHRAARSLVAVVVIPLALLQPVVGHFAGQRVQEMQPLKFAAMEGLKKTEKPASFRMLGLEIPGLLSFLATNNWNSEILGLEAFSEEDHPSPWVHRCFQIMVVSGSLAAFWALWALIGWVRRKQLPEGRGFLKLSVWLCPMGLIATETGWIVAEMGRQPWVIYGVLRTADSVTDRTHLLFSIVLFALVYVGLGITTLLILRNYIRQSPGAEVKRVG